MSSLRLHSRSLSSHRSDCAVPDYSYSDLSVLTFPRRLVISETDSVWLAVAGFTILNRSFSCKLQKTYTPWRALLQPAAELLNTFASIVCDSLVLAAKSLQLVSQGASPAVIIPFDDAFCKTAGV
ncbi:MAG: hypothetical protein EOM06_14860 [Sphingobacteriia bacterium]|nr:hypothetical protein [Sphingobacteriia bacterium]